MKRSFNSYIDIEELEIDKKTLFNLEFLYDNYMSHKFDLLGSGPVKVEYGMKANGFEGIRYRNNVPHIRSFGSGVWLLGIIKARDYFKALKFFKEIDKSYQPIDWHIDYKSGFRFNAKKYDTQKKCREVIDNEKNVEIKAPWEIGRFYHFPQMAILATKDVEKRNKIIREFKNQIIDFIIANPYKRTVQWSAIMDTSIRAVNLLVAYDIMKQVDNDDILDDKFIDIFYPFIKEHGEVIINNLEYIPRCNLNHYLSNIAGLAYIGAYLSSEEKTDAWLVFATQELIEETKRQFNEDGSNFEASTSYHRLSTEFILYPTALILGFIQKKGVEVFKRYKYSLVKRLRSLNQQKYKLDSDIFFPEWYMQKIFLAGMFTKAIMKDNDEIVQIGDNDSGRLLKLSPVGEIIEYEIALGKYKNLYRSNDKQYYDENVLNHSTLLSPISVLFKADNPLSSYQKKLPLEASFVRALACNIQYDWHLRKEEEPILFDEKNLEKINFKFFKTTNFDFPRLTNSFTDTIKEKYFNDFGIVIYKSEKLYMCISIDTMWNKFLAGHSHNDRLSFELIVDGEPIVLDAGTYIYTSSIKRRNQFRSVKGHNSIIVKDIEQDKFLGPFKKTNIARGFIIKKSKTYIKLYAKYSGVHHIREIYIEEKGVVIKDYCNKKFQTHFNKYTYSNGYGKLIRKGWLMQNTK